MKNWRVNFIIAIFAVVYLFLISNLYNLQLVKSLFYSYKAQQQNLATDASMPVRGNIYFTDKNNSNKVQAAVNKEYPAIFAVPTEIDDPRKAALLLAEVLHQDEEELFKKLSKQKDQYELLVSKADRALADKIKALNISGIHFENNLRRFYPSASLASHLLGFVAPAGGDEFSPHEVEEIGQYGVESFFNEELQGEPAKLSGDKIISPVKNGQDIYLTIDRSIQVQSEEILTRLVREKQAIGGSVIVEDPKTGKILAMGSYPNFDPNDYASSEIKDFKNPAIQSLYEPGSIFKIITMSSGLDSGKIAPDTKYTDTGSVFLNGRTIKNWDNKAHGILTMTNVIEHSLNTGTVFAEKQIGHNLFYDYLLKFDLAEKTGITLPSETKGSLKPLSSGRDINFATASFGQGVAFTPIRLIASFAAIANNGNLMKPSILADEKPELIRRVVSEKAAKEMTEMMVKAVKTNVLASIPNYAVAGKTGTAFVPNFQTGGYTDDVINSYVGFAPASDPKFIILIKLDKPYGAPLSGQTVVPAFKELAQFILNYYNVPPDELVANH